MDRRTLLRSLAAAPFWTGLAGRPVPRFSAQSAERSTSSGGRKAVLISMLPKDLSWAQRFALARDAGFDAIEMQTIAAADQAAEIREASAKSGLRIHSVMNM